MVPKVGLEPTRYRYQRILSPSRLPFHHFGTIFLLYIPFFEKARTSEEIHRDFSAPPTVLFDESEKIMYNESNQKMSERCAMPIHESGENYLEAIYMLSEKQGAVRSIDVVNHLGFSKPTVSVAVHTLERNGFLTITPEGHLLLTDSGREIAERIYERHKVLSSILMSLGVPETIALEDACKLEHDLSDLSFERIKLYYHSHLNSES